VNRPSSFLSARAHTPFQESAARLAKERAHFEAAAQRRAALEAEAAQRRTEGEQRFQELREREFHFVDHRYVDAAHLMGSLLYEENNLLLSFGIVLLLW
jgi:hypothetical protein